MTYVTIVLLISMLILIHELGHFVAAKSVGIPVERLSIGFGPSLWSRRIGLTEYRIALIPLGGYVLPAVSDEADYYRIPAGKRIILALGGPAANVLLVLIVLAIVSIAKQNFTFTGLVIEPFTKTFSDIYAIVLSLPAIFAAHSQLTGIIGIVSTGGKVIKSGGFTGFMVFLSLDLAVFNMLPLPVLDGGKIVLALLEKVHPKMIKLQYPLALASLLLVLSLMVYTAVLDIGRLLA